MKNTLVLIAVAFNGFRIFPLWALLCIKQYILRDEYALLFKNMVVFRISKQPKITRNIQA